MSECIASIHTGVVSGGGIARCAPRIRVSGIVTEAGNEADAPDICLVEALDYSRVAGVAAAIDTPCEAVVVADEEPVTTVTSPSTEGIWRRLWPSWQD